MLSTQFAADLQAQLKYKTAEVQSIKDQLTLLDVKIDGYDTIIQNMDKKIIPLVDEINVAITSVKTAYDNRIAAGCKNDLYWEFLSEDEYSAGLFGNYKTTTYICKKNPNVRVNYGYYGAKYYRRPQNQDYGSNIVREFFGTIGAASTILAVFGGERTANLSVGDFIVDNINNPVVFSVNNLPTIVGFGTTSIVSSTIDFQGSVSLGSTIIASTGIGSTGNVNIGDVVILSSLLSPNTKVVGFGTTTITIDNVWDPGSGTFISTTGVTSSLIVSIPAIDTGIGTFKIGPLQSYPGLFLSTSANIDATNINFTAIRNTQVSYTTFDTSNNPIDPVTIGIVDSSTLGYGHKLVKVTNTYPSGPFQWREVMTSNFAYKTDSELNVNEQYLRTTYPEPDCGAGNAEYYPGDTSWPITYAYTYGPGGYPPLSTDTAYAQEGDTVVVVGSGTTIPFGIDTTSTKPPGSASDADCTNIYNAAITAAEASRDAIIARNSPQIDSLIASSSVLRSLRDTLEGHAFALLQGRIYGDVEVNNLTANLTIVQNTDYTPFEPTNYYYNSEEGKYNSSTLGVATT